MKAKDTVDKWLYLSEAQVIYMVNEGKKAGIREVVEWIKERVNFPIFPYKERADGFNQEWQAKLKEWDIAP